MSGTRRYRQTLLEPGRKSWGQFLTIESIDGSTSGYSSRRLNEMSENDEYRLAKALSRRTRGTNHSRRTLPSWLTRTGKSRRLSPAPLVRSIAERSERSST